MAMEVGTCHQARSALNSFLLAAIDLDGTLLGPNKEISKENRTAIKLLRDGGIKIVLASGRKHENILRFYQELQLDGPVVSLNGAVVRDSRSSSTLYQRPLHTEVAMDLVKSGQRHGVSAISYHDDFITVSPSDGWSAWRKENWDELRDIDIRIANLPYVPTYKVMWAGQPWILAALSRRIPRYYLDNLNVVQTSVETLEFNAPGADKASGVAAAASYMKVDRSQVLAFGDGNNDIDLLGWAGLSVAMHHAPTEVQQSATLVAQAGSQHTGFARAVQGILSMLR